MALGAMGYAWLVIYRRKFVCAGENSASLDTLKEHDSNEACRLKQDT